MCSGEKQIKESQGSSGLGHGGGYTQMLEETDARSISQWSQRSYVNLQEQSCVLGKH